MTAEMKEIAPVSPSHSTTMTLHDVNETDELPALVSSISSSSCESFDSTNPFKCDMDRKENKAKVGRLNVLSSHCFFMISYICFDILECKTRVIKMYY